MKKTLRTLALGLLVSGFMATTGWTAEGDVMVYEPLPQAKEVPVVSQDGNQEVVPEAVTTMPDTPVPQAIIDYRDKRLEARMRRDELLKQRAATIKAAGENGPAQFGN